MSEQHLIYFILGYLWFSYGIPVAVMVVRWLFEEQPARSKYLRVLPPERAKLLARKQHIKRAGCADCYWAELHHRTCHVCGREWRRVPLKQAVHMLERGMSVSVPRPFLQPEPEELLMRTRGVLTYGTIDLDFPPQPKQGVV